MIHYTSTDRYKLTAKELVDELYGPPPSIPTSSKGRKKSESKSVSPHYIAIHIGNLAKAAFISGDKRIADLIIGWILVPPEGSARIVRAWALHALLLANFLNTFKEAVDKLCLNTEGREIVDDTLCGDLLGLDAGYYMYIDLSPEQRHTWDALYKNTKPWISEEERVKAVREMFSDFISRVHSDRKGSWYWTGNSVTPKRGPIIQRILDALELKPGAFGMKVDLKKLIKKDKSQ